MKVCFIVGARPQFIKLSPLVKKIGGKFKYIIIHTGQHYDENMSPVFFRELKIPEPDYNLGAGGKNELTQLGEMINKTGEVLAKENCALAVVFGDTTSTLAGALAASKLKIDVAHIEAGMRSYTDMPEEENRRLTDHLSEYLFCSTKQAVENLKKENIKNNVYLVGDIMYDGLLAALKKESAVFSKLKLKKKSYYLMTIHRQENTDNFKRLNDILSACADLDKKVVLALHPRTGAVLRKFGGAVKDYKNILFIEPVGYVDMVNLLKNSKKLLTDSGGLQKEAYLLGVPCITLRDETEWTELVKAGWNILAGADKNKIKKAVLNFTPKGRRVNFYGNGNAAGKIVDILIAPMLARR